MPWNNQNAAQNWQSLGASGFYGANTTYGGGGTFQVGRGELDQLRIGQGRVPSAEYPDGFLGTVPSRRGDRLLASVKSRVNQRSYQRGVHKGERIDPGDYGWPKDFGPQSGLQAVSRGVRQAPVFELALPPHLVNDGKTDMRANQPVDIDARRVEQLSRMRPAWR